MTSAHRRRALATSLLVGVLAVVAGCSSSDGGDGRPAASAAPTSESPHPKAPASTGTAAGTGPSYVALGDSYVSGPGIATQQPAAGLCFRSDHDYPALLAAAIGARRFRDASCSGATTADVLLPHTIGQATRPAQLDAVTAGTRLVTIGIGGNDGRLFSTLLNTCARAAGTARCRDLVAGTVPRLLATTTTKVTRTLRAVRSKAPRARVLLVGYLRILPDTGGCPAVGLAADDVPSVLAGEVALDAALRTAARDAGVDYLSLQDASRGHDACAGAEAWTNGASGTPDDGILFHPRAAGMAAVARLVEARLRS